MSVLVLGIGNICMTDDGLGIVAIQRLKQQHCFPQEVAIIEGGTMGLSLLPYLEGVDRLLIIDSINCGYPPGTIIRLTGEEVPASFGIKLSRSQIGVQDLLAAADLLGHLPDDRVLLGVQPALLEWGMELSTTVAAKLDTLIENLLEELSGWGVAYFGRFPKPYTFSSKSLGRL